MSTVLVTGGAGYVGSHAVKALVEAGADVVVYDDLSAGHAEAIERIAHAHPSRSISLVRGDILDTDAVHAALERSGASAVMHFAARLLVEESTRKPFDYYRANLDGALSVLQAMVRAGVSHFVFSSTCATFGEPQADTIDERHPQRPTNTYGETKLAVERALPHVERASGLRWTVLRYFNAAGADPSGLIGEDHQPEEHVIPRAIAAVRAGTTLTIFGDDYPTPDGTCVRDYVHVRDLASAHLLALDRLRNGGVSTSYNLGSGSGISVRQIVDAVGRAAGHPVPHVVGPRRAGDPSRLVASSARAAHELGWRLQLGDVQQIVDTAWRWHETHPNGYGSSGTHA